MSFWGAAAGQAAGSIVGAIGQGIENKKHFKRTQELMDIQQRNQMALNTQAANLSYDMWQKTNYPAQVEMMKKAGVNPALLYGKGGAGGTTAQTGSGGSATSGQAPPPVDFQGIGNSAAIVTEMLLKKAQTRNLNADAKSKELDNEVKEQYGQDADMYAASNRRDHELTKGQYLYEGLKSADAGQRKRAVLNMENLDTIKDVEARIAKETEEDVKRKIAYETASTRLDKHVKEANINLTKEQERKIWHDIWQGWVKAGFQGLDSIIKGRLGDIGKNFPKKGQ